MRTLITSTDAEITFLCGGSRNWAAFVPLLDGVFVLQGDVATLHRRLYAGPDDEWGGEPPVRALVTRRHATGEGACRTAS